jgi:aspartyl-tRNA(Asn)/glutamyl-tRNA(Gln) amidotransferase subunit A
MTSEARAHLDEALARMRDPAGEGRRTCLTVYHDAATAAADAADARRRAGVSLGPLDGVIVTVKDLFDVAGEPTRAGSKVLADAPPARSDAPVVRRLRAAGAVIVAKTNMTEFAFSGIGLNPHYGTPGNPADRDRVPGGSSSGAAVAVADGMGMIGIGTDTGGSTRIPAALCGIVGLKPSRQRVPTEGAFPLSYTFDSIGPLARTVTDCAAADTIMAGEDPRPLEPLSAAGLRLGVLQGLPLRDLDSIVETRFAAALAALSKGGVRLVDHASALIDDMVAVNAKGGFVMPEAYAIHREMLASRRQDFDPLVAARIERGRELSAADYVAMSRQRARLVRQMDEQVADLDGLVLPTTPIVAPRMAEVSTPETFHTKNVLVLRNTSIINFFDLCAISLPVPGPGLPVGLMLVARNGADRRLLRMAAAIEHALAA